MYIQMLSLLEPSKDYINTTHFPQKKKKTKSWYKKGYEWGRYAMRLCTRLHEEYMHCTLCWEKSIYMWSKYTYVIFKHVHVDRLRHSNQKQYKDTSKRDFETISVYLSFMKRKRKHKIWFRLCVLLLFFLFLLAKSILNFRNVMKFFLMRIR